MTDSKGLSWKTLDRKQIYRAEPWIDLSVEMVQLPDGKIVEDFHQLTLPDFATVFTETEDGKILMLRQYKHGPRKVGLMLPGGIVEPNEDHADAVKRELLEETGYRAEGWCFLGSFAINANLGCGNGHIYRASGAIQIQEPDSGDYEEMEILLLDKSQVISAVLEGRIQVMSHVAAIFLALNDIG